MGCLPNLIRHSIQLGMMHCEPHISAPGNSHQPAHTWCATLPNAPSPMLRYLSAAQLLEVGLLYTI